MELGRPYLLRNRIPAVPCSYTGYLTKENVHVLVNPFDVTRSVWSDIEIKEEPVTAIPQHESRSPRMTRPPPALPY